MILNIGMLWEELKSCELNHPKLDANDDWKSQLIFDEKTVHMQYMMQKNLVISYKFYSRYYQNQMKVTYCIFLT